MSITIPDAYRDLLDGPNVATLATIMPDGHPQLSIVWCNTEGDTVLVNTAVGRQKDKNLRARPRATLLVVDPENTQRYIEVRGIVELVAEDAVDHIDELARLYTHADSYYVGLGIAHMAEKETRVKFRIVPTKILAFG